jgi:histidinol-phosphate aminotransferase
MYEVCANINDVEYRNVMLDENYQITAEKLLAACDANTKAIWICSPNNPTGNDINNDEIEKVIENFDGIVIVDEAYIDFSKQKSFNRYINSETSNVIVLQTMSKAWGSAAIRLGMAFAKKEIIAIFNKVKYPYNVNQLTQEQAMKRLKDTQPVEQWVNILLQERGRTMEAFGELPICEKIYPTDANFFLAKVKDAQKTYDYLVDKGIIVRNRTRVSLCNNCLRVTIGTREENNELLGALRDMK